MTRLAEERDIIGILKLIRNNIEVVGIDCAEASFSSQTTSLLIQNSIRTKLCTVAISEGKIVGVCLGTISINVFCSDVFQIQLLVNLIDPEYRDTSLGGRNFIEWNAIVKALCKEEPRVGGVFVGQQPTGTNIDFEKRGYKLSHTNWLMEV